MFLFILGILALIAGVIVSIYLGVEYGFGRATIAGVITLIVVALCIGGSCVANVPTGHTGVLTTFGKVENVTFEAGMNFKAPWQNVVKMDNRVQKESTDLICFSSDIQEVSMRYTVNYQISSKDAMTIYKTIGTDYYNNIIVPNITESVKTEVAKYTADALISDRSSLANAIQQNLTTRLVAYNIIVVSASIEDMDFTDAFTDAVEAKQVAEQNKLKAQTEAEQKVIEAEAQAAVKKTQADAEAYEIKVKAEAEAEANKKLAQSITQQLIDYKYYETWDGKLPGVMGADTIIKMPE